MTWTSAFAAIQRLWSLASPLGNKTNMGSFGLWYLIGYWLPALAVVATSL
jgi:hypothetical protein